MGTLSEHWVGVGGEKGAGAWQGWQGLPHGGDRICAPVGTHQWGLPQTQASTARTRSGRGATFQGLGTCSYHGGRRWGR